MGLFNIFKKHGENKVLNGKELQPSHVQNSSSFKEPRLSTEDINQTNGTPGENGLYLLYQLLDRNYEQRGYEDALLNPDQTNLNQNLEELKNELHRTIRKVNSFYDDFIREVEFHIISRSRSGMADMVEELMMKKETALIHLEKIKVIQQDAKENTGDCQGILLSYTRGFRNGLAAISHHSILKRKF